MKSNEEIGVKYMQAWEERYYDRQEAREEGLAEGRAEGRAEGKKELLLEVLEDIGKVPEELKKKIFMETDLTVLKKWIKLAARAESMEQFEREIL